ncbi:MAG TPA: hypothetical protein VGW58_06850 [Pyrinomonadaceae bacterium]|nr:hypothetical protein [Pyrinomonadaceae bacterium]
MSISARTAFTSSTLILMFLLLLTLLGGNGCKDIGEGLTKLVSIEYDQPVNFTEYEFATTHHSKEDNGPFEEWRQIRLDDHSDVKKGVWMVYLLCSIKNNAPKAETFNYDVSKFYVDYGGRKHYYKNLAAYTYAGVSPVQIPSGGNKATEELAPAFRTETQLGPDQESIPPGADRSIAYRLVIYVWTETGDLTDLTKLNQRLYYDDTPVNMIDRNNDTSAAGGVVRGSSLPTVCRPPRK